MDASFTWHVGRASEIATNGGLWLRSTSSRGLHFWLSAYMSKVRFVDITSAIQYMDTADPLLFVNKFHKVRQMIETFNEQYAREFSPAWIICLNKSMNSWDWV